MSVFRPSLILVLVFFVVGFQARGLEREQHLQLPMVDGKELATDVYLPHQGDGPWPTLLVRSTYGRDFPVQGLIESDWVRGGYALVVQDVRGTLFSSREIDMFYSDGWREDLHDGRDTVDWITAQPWSDGKVGTTGESGLGMPAYLIGPSTPKVTAQFIIKSPPSFYHHAVFHGGVLREDLVKQWLSVMGRADMIEKYALQPLYGDFWKPYDTIAQVANEPAAGFFVGAWYDVFQQGILDAFTAREYGADSASRGKNHLVMLADTHRPPLSKDYTFRNHGGPSIGALKRKFFDAELRGDLHAMEDVPKVQYFVLGADTPGAPGNEWRKADCWPPFETREASFLLGPDNTLHEGAPASPAATLGFAADPLDPYPTWGGPNLSYDVPIGPYDQRKYSETRKDFLSFATPPLDAPLEVTGRVRVVLYVSTDAADTDFTAKLVDIYPAPDGRVINVLDGIRRLKYRGSPDHVEPYTPGSVVPVEIDLWSTSIVFAAGHRIGLHVAGSNAPRFAVNPNTGAEELAKGAPSAVAHNTVYLSAERPSALILPVRKD